MNEGLILSLIYLAYSWFNKKSKKEVKYQNKSFIDDFSKNFTSGFKDRPDYINTAESPNNIGPVSFNDSLLNDKNIVQVTNSKTDDSEIIKEDSAIKKINLHKKKKIKRDLKTLIKNKIELRNFIILKEVLDKPRALKKNIR